MFYMIFFLYVSNSVVQLSRSIPTIILSFVTIAFYLIGNAFSDAADPKNHLQ